MAANRPLNLGLVDALSRIGGYSKPELPALLEGIQGVLIYGDVSKSVASEVFEARAVCGLTAAGFDGFEISSEAPGGIVIEEIDATAAASGGLPTLAINIVKTPAGVAAATKLDVGGLPTSSHVTHLPAVQPIGSLLVWTVTFITGGGASQLSIQNRTRMWVPPGSFFQVFPAGASVNPFNCHVTWRELSDVQGAP